VVTQELAALSTVPVKSNEQIAWDFFIAKGYTAEQSAGILGNLKQEHNFKTDDVPGGLGIAQWVGARRERLIQRGNHLDFQTQLDYMIEELSTTEVASNTALKGARTVEQATLAFQYLYERCGDCRQGTRLNYAIDIYYKYR